MESWNVFVFWSGGDGYCLREYHHTEGRNAVVLICNYTSRGMDLRQHATNLSAALKVGSLLEIPRCLVILYLSSLQSTVGG